MPAKVVTGLGIPQCVANLSVSSVPFSFGQHIGRTSNRHEKHVERLKQVMQLGAPIFGFDDVVGQNVTTGFGQSTKTAMVGLKHGVSHFLPREVPVLDPIHRQDVPVAKMIEAEVQKRLRKVLL